VLSPPAAASGAAWNSSDTKSLKLWLASATRSTYSTYGHVECKLHVGNVHQSDKLGQIWDGMWSTVKSGGMRAWDCVETVSEQQGVEGVRMLRMAL
jgi:hypothetical protein